jgi:hypothetical protein
MTEVSQREPSAPTAWLETPSIAHPAADRAIDVLRIEYDTLRAEIMGHQSNRFQFLVVSTTVAVAIVAAAHFVKGDATSTWLTASIGFVILAIGYLSFLHMGRAIVALSEGIAIIEARINSIMHHAYGTDADLLRWETARTQQSGPRFLGQRRTR